MSPGGTKSGTVQASFNLLDPALALVVNRWSSLPERVRQEVVAKVMGWRAVVDERSSK